MATKIKGYYYTGSFYEWRAKELVTEARKKGYKAEMWVSRKNFRRYYQVRFWKPEEVKKLASRRAKRKPK